jgi:mono/diheme cytochrome c family protein
MASAMSPAASLLFAVFATSTASPAGEGDRPASSVPIAGLRAIDVAGRLHHIGRRESTRAVAFVFLSEECPISNQYVAELNRLAAVQPKDLIEFYGVVADRTTTRKAAAEFAKNFQIEFPVLFDASGEIATLLDPSHVPQAFVLSRRGDFVYRGRIDNLYAALGKRRPAPTECNLADALDAAARGLAPAVAETDVVGCKIEKSRRGADLASATFHRDVAPILHAHCVECHRPGEVAPFPLLSYEDAAKRAGFLVEVVEGGRMPPWKLRPDFGHFLDERRLSDHEISVLRAWSEAGAPAGDPADQPPTPQFPEGWRLGTPDLVLRMAAPYSVPASGPDVFRFFVIPVEIPEDRVVTAVEFRPGNPRIAHHAIMYVDRTGAARRRDAATPEPGYEGFLTGGFRPQGVLGFWAPGYTPRFLPDDVGITLRSNSDVALQMHYHPSGRPEVDQSEIGLYFAKKPVENELGGLALINFDVNIPPGEKRRRMEFSFTTPVDVEIAEVVPHVHMIGTEMKVTATLPDGRVEPLVWIDWEFNWQDQFRYAEIVKLPAGTRFDLEAYFDNSGDNPYNPHSPPKRVLFGEMTTDEMCICAFRTIEKKSGDDRRILGEALRKSMEDQLKNPMVALNVARFLLAGQGGPARAADSRAKPGEGDSTKGAPRNDSK